MFAWIAHHWLLSAGGIGVVALIVFAPAVAMTLLRWLLGTEVGRYLLLAAVVVGLGAWGWDARFSAGRAACMADQKAAAESARADAAEQVVTRDDASADATQDARSTADDRIAEHNTRAARVEAIAHEPRPAVPVVCPAPDPRLLRESRDAAARIRAAEDRLRGY